MIIEIMNILITNFFLKNFTGSEINTLQLCDELLELGHSTDVATFFYDNPMKALFEKRNIKVTNLLIEKPAFSDYDLFWTHHIHTVNHIIFNTNPRPAKMIYSCLGPFSPLATPPFYHDQLSYILSNSRGNTDVLTSEGVSKNKIFYFPNFAPKSFFSQQKVKYSTTPAKIAIISNHPPKELHELSLIFSSIGISTDFIGFGGKQIFVDPAILIKYDLVISIGKTAQYCFSTKVPFYCYDHFGGPGYITQDNLNESETYNFSGRAINRNLSGRELFEDITSNYQRNLENLRFLSDYCFNNFSLEKNIHRLFDQISELNDIDFAKIHDRNPLIKRTHNETLRLLNIQKNLEDQINRQQVKQVKKSPTMLLSTDLEQEVLFYATSKSWRLTRPIRKFANLVRKLINDKAPH